MAAVSTDRIQKETILKAPRSRVWELLANAEEFGRWFGVDLSGQTFAPGQRARGRFTTPGYEHYRFDVLVEEVEPERRLSFRWHPYNFDQQLDFEKDPSTFVVFELTGGPDTTILTVTESGFDRIPSELRGEAYRGNEEGWEAQLKAFGEYVHSRV